MERDIRLDWQSLITEAKRQRKAKKFTQYQLAILAGVSKPTLSNFEQGKTTVTLENAFKILRTLGLMVK